MSTAQDTIAARTSAMQAGRGRPLPPEATTAFAAEQARLRAAGRPAALAEVGTPLPAADLLDPAGRPTSVAATAGGRPAVLVLYRGAWCPYCNLALRAYQELLVPELDERGIVLIAVSPQRPDGSLTTRQTQELTYAVLSDPGNQIAAGLGVLTEPGPDVVAAQSGLGLDLTAVNADGTRTLPMPTTVLLDGAGTIRWIDVHPDYTGRTEPADILHVVDAHLG
jgi:peroxiredoxin